VTLTHRTALLFVAAGIALVGCDSSDDTPAKPKVQVVTGHAKAPPGAFDKAAFKCCDTPEATTLVKGFSDLGAKLAADDEAGARAAAGDFAVALEAGAAGFTGALAPLATASGAFRSAADIEAVRAAYLTASEPMLAFAKAHQGGTAAYAIAHCPMKPGSWLQAEPELANPYYGAQMLRCGNFEAMK